MKIKYASDLPNTLSADDVQIYERILHRRGEHGLLPLDRALLIAPKLANGWNSLLGAVRTQSTLPADIREICICRPALINRAWFEWAHHAPMLAECPSFSLEKMKVVQRLQPSSQGALSDQQWAVLQYADAITQHVHVKPGLFERLGAVGFCEQEIMEITLTIACYNMVSRFLVALDVGEMNNSPPDFMIR